MRTTDPKNTEQRHKNPVVKKLNLALLKKDSDDNIPVKLNNLSKMSTDKSCQDLKMHLLLGKLHQKETESMTQESQMEEIEVYEDLHITMILLILQLIVDPQTQKLDQRYVTQFPQDSGLLNIPIILHKHLNRSKN